MNDLEKTINMDLETQIQIAIKMISSQGSFIKKTRIKRRKDSVEEFIERNTINTQKIYPFWWYFYSQSLPESFSFMVLPKNAPTHKCSRAQI